MRDTGRDHVAETAEDAAGKSGTGRMGRNDEMPHTVSADVLDAAKALERSGRFSTLRRFTQHGSTSVYDHVVSVASEACRMADALARLGIGIRRAELIRGALLHDYFLYDWHDPNNGHRLHGFSHPFTALRNAEENYALTDREQNVIVRHMFPLVPVPPTCREAWVVCIADKIVALRETISGRARR